MNDLFDDKEFFEERAAIREFMGEQPREEAEANARADVELYKFQCLIRQLILWARNGEREKVKRWLDGADLRYPRDPEQRKIYADTLNEQMELGNTGTPKEWILF